MSILKGIKFKNDETIHQLDYEQGLANKPKLVKSWNDLEGKPFYSEGEETDLLSKQSLVFTYDESISGYAYNVTSSLGINVMFEAGKEYSVCWDDKTYKCTGESIMFGEISGVAIGNTSIAGGTQNNNEPFIMYYAPDYNYTSIVLLAGEDTHEVRIYQGEEIIHHVPSKFIKDMYHIKGIKKEDILPSQNVGRFEFNSVVGAYNYNVIPANLKLNAGETYYIEWDNVEYTMTGIEFKSSENYTCVGVGNALLFGGENDGTPFGIVYDIDLEYLHYFSLGSEQSHLVRISHDVEDIEKIPSKYVDGYTKEETENLIANAITKALNTEV